MEEVSEVAQQDCQAGSLPRRVAQRRGQPCEKIRNGRKAHHVDGRDFLQDLGESRAVYDRTRKIRLPRPRSVAAGTPQSQRMFFVAMAMLCEVDAPSVVEQMSDDLAIAAAADADLVLNL